MIVKMIQSDLDNSFLSSPTKCAIAQFLKRVTIYTSVNVDEMRINVSREEGFFTYRSSIKTPPMAKWFIDHFDHKEIVPLLELDIPSNWLKQIPIIKQGEMKLITPSEVMEEVLV